MAVIEEQQLPGFQSVATFLRMTNDFIQLGFFFPNPMPNSSRPVIGKAIQEFTWVCLYNQHYMVVFFYKLLRQNMIEELDQRIIIAFNIEQATGFFWKPSCAHVQISINFSSVPIPPGSAMKPSESSPISIFLSCIDWVTYNSVRFYARLLYVPRPLG